MVAVDLSDPVGRHQRGDGDVEHLDRVAETDRLAASGSPGLGAQRELGQSAGDEDEMFTTHAFAGLLLYYERRLDLS